MRRLRDRNEVVLDTPLARVGASTDGAGSGGNGVVTAMLATLGVILFLGLFAAGDAASGRAE